MKTKPLAVILTAQQMELHLEFPSYFLHKSIRTVSVRVELTDVLVFFCVGKAK